MRPEADALYLQPVKPLLLLLLCALAAVHGLYAQDSTAKPLSFSGYVEVYYQYDFNRPLGSSRPAFLYSHHRTGEVNLNLGFIKAAYTAPRVRASLALMAGTYAQTNLAAEPDVFRNVFEANAGVKLSAQKELWLDAGILPSHIGFESAIGKDCPTVTRSMMADNSPYYEAGLRLGYTSANGRWYLAALLLNGWQRIQRPPGNSTPAAGTQVTYKPSAKITLNSSTFIGNDKPDSVRQMRYFHSLYGIFKTGAHSSVTLGLDAGMEQKVKRSSAVNTWLTAVAIGRFETGKKTALALRAEYYADDNGVIIATAAPGGFRTWGASVNVDYAILPNVLWRAEVRYLHSRSEIFERRNSMPVQGSASVVTSLAVAF